MHQDRRQTYPSLTIESAQAFECIKSPKRSLRPSNSGFFSERLVDTGVGLICLPIIIVPASPALAGIFAAHFLPYFEPLKTFLTETASKIDLGKAKVHIGGVFAHPTYGPSLRERTSIIETLLQVRVARNNLTVNWDTDDQGRRLVYDRDKHAVRCFAGSDMPNFQELQYPRSRKLLPQVLIRLISLPQA